jgi:hypothetical protein
MNGNRVVKAVFDWAEYLLKVTRIGNGKVTSSPAGISCGSGSSCEAKFQHPKEVTLSAAADPGSLFAGWHGAATSAGCDGTGATSTCTVQMTKATEVEARFVPEPVGLALAATGSGSGEVDCSVGSAPPAPCASEYDFGTELTLIPTAATGSEFTGFQSGTGSAAACAGTLPCTFTIEADSGVEAEFELVTHRLTVVRSGAGSGVVTSDPTGLVCGSECEAQFAEGEIVALAAAPAPGSRFEGWSGACTGLGACLVTINAAREVGASFSVVPPPPPDDTLWPPPSDPAPGNPGPGPQGTPRVAGNALVSGDRAALKVTCLGRGSCKGQFRLFVKLPAREGAVKVRQSRRVSRVLIGEAPFELGAGESKAIDVRILNRQVRSALLRGNSVHVQAVDASGRRQNVTLFAQSGRATAQRTSDVAL